MAASATDALGLEHLDLQPDPHGFLTVGDTLNTSADNVWAIGDLRGGPMFTHTARDDADIVYRTVYRDQDRTTTGRVVPHAVFTDPEVGAVGLTEPAARAAGYDVIIGRQNFTGVAKARAIGNTRGLVKFVFGGAPGGEQQVAAGDLGGLGAGAADPDVAGRPGGVSTGGGGRDSDAVGSHAVGDGGADVGVFPGQQPVGALDDGDLGAESPEHLREFAADVAAADDEQVGG